MSCTFHTCELENNLYNKNQPHSGEEIVGKYPCHLVPPLDRTLAVFADKKTRALRTTRCDGNVYGWTCKSKRTTTTVESMRKITIEKRNRIQSDQSVFRKNITRRFDVFFFAETQPVHQPFLLVGGRCFKFLLYEKSMKEAISRSWQKTNFNRCQFNSNEVQELPTSISGSFFFCIQPVLFFVCFSPAAQEIDNRLETPNIFMS